MFIDVFIPAILIYLLIGLIVGFVQAIALETGKGFGFRVVAWPVELVRGLIRSFKTWRSQ
jgi:type III secretory pathway component EscS